MIADNLIYKLLTEMLGKDVFSRYKEDYSVRLMVQKIIYIFQEKANAQAYRFNWYLAGPYSTELTSQIYSNLTALDDTKKNEWDKLEFNERGKEIIKQVREFFEVDGEELKQQKLSKSDWYELMASLYYLRKRDNIVKKDDLLNSFLHAKDKFSSSQVSFAIDKYGDKLGLS